MVPQSASWAEMVGRKRSAKELRALWRKAIMEQILLIRMEKENNSLQGTEYCRGACTRDTLYMFTSKMNRHSMHYRGITIKIPCSTFILWGLIFADFVDRNKF